MTDYLEELLNRAGPLLEELQRLERNVPAARRAAGGDGPGQSGVRRGGETPAAPSGLRAGTGEEAERTADGFPAPAPEDKAERVPAAQTPAEAGRQEERLPLLDQLERLERTGLLAETPAGGSDIFREDGLERAGRQTGLAGLVRGSAGLEAVAEDGRRVSLFAAGPAAGERPGFSPGMEEESPGWPRALRAQPETAAPEEDWAERCDRVFRRDSRRYDGGFYLF